MNAPTNDLDALERDLLARIDAAKDDAALEALRVEALGKQGSISALMKNLGTMSPDERKTFGPKLNGLKDKVGEAIAVKKVAFAEAALDAQLKAEAVDVTLPPIKPRLGTIHPVSRVMEELALIFGEMGFSVEEGPDIETEWFNFTALNTPEKHPARDLQDTFYLNGHGEGGRKLLRTQTSPVQIRTMQKQTPPIRMICMGRTYRRDNDATHTPMFHQIEGLVIDKTSTMADLKGVLTGFLKAYFETDAIELRFRPHFFPFTEPSAEMDMRWDRGKGEARWLELGGCGMVHPNVLKNCGIDPNEYQGYAWGFGLDRMAMLKYGMNDLRPLFESDTRWMKHYGFSPFLLPGLANGVGQ